MEAIMNILRERERERERKHMSVTNSETIVEEEEITTTAHL